MSAGDLLKLEGAHGGGIGFKMLCAGGSIWMSTHLSGWALLTRLAFAVLTLGPTIAEAQTEVPDAANLYPGRYAAVCKPAPIFGCVCATDSTEEALMFTELDSKADHHLKDVADSEYLRMISWLRRTCESLTQPATYRQHHFIHSPRWAYHHCNREKPRFQKGNCWR
jgi:hypothetical protein